MDSDNLDGLKGDDKIIAEAKKRFELCQKWESVARERFIEDTKFANADSDNGFQWPNNLMNARISIDKPCITINKTAQHNLQIINDAKQNKPSVKIRPTGGGASFDASEVYEGIIRHIEYISNAQTVYDSATTHQVEGGWDYWRIITDYADNDSFDQEIFIAPIKGSPFSVYLDPDIKHKDGLDAKYGFIFDDIPRDEFMRENPEFKSFGAPRVALGNNDMWLTDKHIRIAEYFRINEKRDLLVAMRMPDGNTQTVRRSEIPREILDEVLADPTTKKRDIISNEVEWYKIAGNEIIDRRVGDKSWKGKYIPIVRLIGRETVIEGQLDRKGHTRALKDAQRMYNYNSSASIEYGALQTKAPWLAPAQAIEEYTKYWSTANTENHAVLPYNHIDDDGNPIPPPQRVEPPQGAQFYVQEREASAQDMMFVSGQYQADMGAESNERSGKAINERQRMGDKATYHFIDNLGIAIRATGKVLIDLIPKIYDTPRVMKILAEDGSQKEIKLDPNAKQAFQANQASEQDVVAGIFNPNVGKYEVEADIGPAYATRRQEAFNAFSQIAAQNPELMTVVGDLLFKNADFPGADEIAERMKRMVPPQALGEGISPQIQQMQVEMQKLSKALEASIQQLAEERLKYKGKEQQKDIDAYKAITDRLETILAHVVVTPKDNAKMLHDVMTQEHQSNLNMVEATTQHEMEIESVAKTQESADMS